MQREKLFKTKNETFEINLGELKIILIQFKKNFDKNSQLTQRVHLFSRIGNM